MIEEKLGSWEKRSFRLRFGKEKNLAENFVQNGWK